ncbi:uncharacterized protein [Musca autumnalis]|uniref:uncharacterized protein n=1 Tax=Musca autumnalis TaxID=221902 RepID=UPI003CEA372D
MEFCNKSGWIILIFISLKNVMQAVPIPYATRSFVVNRTKAADVAIEILTFYNYIFDYRTPSINEEVGKLLSYLKEINTPTSNRSDLKGYENLQQTLVELKSTINRMDGNCGIFNTLLLMGPKVVQDIQELADEELATISKPLITLIDVNSDKERINKTIEEFIAEKKNMLEDSQI